MSEHKTHSFYVNPDVHKNVIGFPIKKKNNKPLLVDKNSKEVSRIKNILIEDGILRGRIKRFFNWK